MNTLFLSTTDAAATQGIQAIIDNAWVWFIAPIAAVLALIAALLFSRNVMSKSEGEPEMIRIAQAVRQGAMAYLVRQYKVVTVVFIILIAILVALGFLGIQPKATAIGNPKAKARTETLAHSDKKQWLASNMEANHINAQIWVEVLHPAIKCLKEHEMFSDWDTPW